VGPRSELMFFPVRICTNATYLLLWRGSGSSSSVLSLFSKRVQL
jgi:hypothetical protein